MPVFNCIVTKRVPKYLCAVRAAARTNLSARFRDLKHPRHHQGFACFKEGLQKAFFQVLDVEIGPSVKGREKKDFP